MCALGTALPAQGLEIESQFPSFSSRQVLTTEPLSLRFSGSLDPASVNGATFFVTVKHDGASVAGSVSLESGQSTNDTLVFTPAEPWAWGVRYWIHIEPALKGLDGSSFDGRFPDLPFFVANIPNDFQVLNQDPDDLSASWVGDGSTVLMGYNPLDPEGVPAGPHEIPGLNVTGAWKYTLGRPDVVVAVVDNGFTDYGDPDIRTALYLNTGELPLPRSGDTPCDGYDCNGDGRFDVDDYAGDPRVLAVSGEAPVNVGHLIQVFSDGSDDDDNGLADDISGWDFYRNTNVILGVSEFPEGVHGEGECKLIAAPGNDGRGSVPGICPRCRVLFVRASQQLIYDFGLVAAGVRYALEMGADLINFAGVPGGYSSEAHQVFIDAYEAGVLTVAPSGDEMGMHHWWPAAGEDVLSVKTIFPMVPGELWEGGLDSSEFGFMETPCTNFGPHVFASIPAVTGCTSDSTANTSGMLALILSHARQLGIDLSAGELLQVLIASCDDIADHCFSIPEFFNVCQPGFDMHFGYGRPDAERALLILGDPDQRIPARIPPDVRITHPRWWETVDPYRTPDLEVRGSIDARTLPLDYQVQIARGTEPLEEEFVTVCSGTAHEAMEGVLCSIPLLEVLGPEEVRGVPVSQFEYDTTLRVRASYAVEGERVRGEMRKAISVHADDDPGTGLVPGFPVDMGGSGSASPVLYDLDGDPDGRLEIVLATSDGRIHVLKYHEPSGRWTEMAGFPVDVRGEDPRVHGTIHASPAVADLLGDGVPRIVAATSRGEVFVIQPEGDTHPDGSPFLEGFPVRTDPPPNGSARAYGHGHGIIASPVPADLDGDGLLEIVVGCTDQQVYVWRSVDRDGDGRADRLPGWPVLCRSEAGRVPEDALCETELPAQILTTPAVGILDPRADDPDIRERPCIIASTTEVCGAIPFSSTRVYAIYHDGNAHAGGPFLAGWPVRPAVPLGDAIPLPMAIGSTMSPMVSVEEDVTKVVVGSAAFFPQIIYVRGEDLGLQTVVPDLNLVSMASGALAPLAGDGVPSIIVPTLSALYMEEGDGHLLSFKIMTNASNDPWPVLSSHQIEDLPIWLGPAAADLDNDGTSEIIVGGAGQLVHAFSVQGGEAPGWPKYTQKWVTGTPAVGDMDADGRLEIVLPTQEGFLYAWETEGSACVEGKANAPWSRFQHDARNSGYYGADVIPPARITDLSVQPLDGDGFLITFTAPGDDGSCGRAARYDLRYAGNAEDLDRPAAFENAIQVPGAPDPMPAGAEESVRVQAPGAVAFAVRATDDAGNRSRVSNTVVLPQAASEGSSEGGCGCSQFPHASGNGGVNLGMLSLGALFLWIVRFRRRPRWFRNTVHQQPSSTVRSPGLGVRREGCE